MPALAKRSANPSANGDGRASAVAPLDLSRADHQLELCWLLDGKIGGLQAPFRILST